jgi:hypothetical protein
MYKAITNNYCGGVSFEAGKVYTKKEIEGLDINDFELVTGDEIKEEKPKSMTTDSIKPKKVKK